MVERVFEIPLALAKRNRANTALAYSFMLFALVGGMAVGTTWWALTFAVFPILFLAHERRRRIHVAIRLSDSVVVLIDDAGGEQELPLDALRFGPEGLSLGFIPIQLSDFSAEGSRELINAIEQLIGADFHRRGYVERPPVR